MNTIVKVPLAILAVQTISLPGKNKFLSVQVQDGKPVAWYCVDPNAEPNETERKLIACCPPGGEGPLDTDAYLGTVQTPDGFVWHYFEEVKPR